MRKLIVLTLAALIVIASGPICSSAAPLLLIEDFAGVAGDEKLVYKTGTHTDHSAPLPYPTWEFCIDVWYPVGKGTGDVSPPPGWHCYPDFSWITFCAYAGPGSCFDYWLIGYNEYYTSLVEWQIWHHGLYAYASFAIDPLQFCSPNDIFAQTPNATLVAPCSDAYDGMRVADDFFGLTKPIAGFDFWGGEQRIYSCWKPSLDFIISFYEYGPLPGDLVYEETITVEKVPTRKTLFNNPYRDCFYKYTGVLSTPVTLTEGWFSVQAVDSGSCVFLWADAGLASSDYGYVFWDDEFGGWSDSGFDYNLAFCLHEDPSAPTPTPTPTPTKPPEPTPTPEPTPEYPLGVRLEMPETAHPGDEFFIIGYLDNPGETLSKVPTFFILEVYGKFWFWPSWAYFDYPEYPEIDWKNIYVPTGTTIIAVVPPFEWPDTGSDIVTGLGFYGAMLNPDVTDILGEIAYQEWGYGP